MRIVLVDPKGVWEGLNNGLASIAAMVRSQHSVHVIDFVNKKVGSKIFDRIKDYCHKNNIRVIKLDSGNDNIEAHRFYQKNGGKQTEKMFRFDLR